MEDLKAIPEYLEINDDMEFAGIIGGDSNGFVMLRCCPSWDGVVLTDETAIAYVPRSMILEIVFRLIEHKTEYHEAGKASIGRVLLRNLRRLPKDSKIVVIQRSGDDDKVEEVPAYMTSHFGIFVDPV